MALTLGNPGAPSQKIINFDALLTTSIANYSSKLEDAVSSNNQVFKKIKDSKMWTSYDGGTHLEISLMYALNSIQAYKGYDVLNTDPIEGLTKVMYEWSRLATPISFNGDDETDNMGMGKVIDLIATKMTQAELGMQEGFGKHFLQGNLANAGNVYDSFVDPGNGATSLLPIARLIHYNPSSSLIVGNLDQATYTWWRNKTVSASGITLYDQLLQKFENLINECSKGAGGSPDMIITDQTTFELLKLALFHRTRTEPKVNMEWPFENVIIRRTMVIWDEFICDPVTNVANTTTYGVAYAVNTKFFGVKYHPRRNFVHRKFQEPYNQDAKISHILWKGQTFVNNRRKHGVLHTIPRTLSYS